MMRVMRTSIMQTYSCSTHVGTVDGSVYLRACTTPKAQRRRLLSPFDDVLQRCACDRELFDML